MNRLTDVDSLSKDTRSNSATVCLHCSTPCLSEFCCVGCESIYRLMREQSLERFYDLKDCPIPPARETGTDPMGRMWLERAASDLAKVEGITTLRLSIEGINCAACVWLLEELTTRAAKGASIVVNPVLGTVELTAEKDFPLLSFADTVQRFGYQLGPERTGARPRSDDLLWRMGVSIALGLNIMSFAVARYAGLADTQLSSTLMTLELVLASISLWVGGPVFFRGAWQGLKRGMLHLDLPIVVGLLTGYGGSVALYLAGRHDAVYFDTISIFLALMLLGRFLRERVLEKNRATLLTDAEAGALLVRRKAKQVGAEALVEVVPAESIVPGDELILAPRDVSPVLARLAAAEARFSAAWLTGESEERTLKADAAVLAGMANAEASPVTVIASEAFAESRLLPLLRTPVRDERYADSQSARERFISRYWVIGVLLVAALGATIAYARTQDWLDTLGTLTAILVVTCPCGFGIATPLANELTLMRLRQEGVLVRSSTLLERLLAIRTVIFDKTGTLTESRLSEATRQQLLGLPVGERAILANLAQRSRHPKAVALAAALRELESAPWLELATHEQAGRGLVVSLDGHSYALGSPRWLGADPSFDIVFARDGEVLLAAKTEDCLFADASRTVRELGDLELTSYLATGDAEERALRVARTCAIPESRVFFEATPESKAAIVKSLGGKSLFVGDGLNDALAATAAYAAGTPVAGTTFLAARTDFYLLRPGVNAIAKLFRSARALAKAQDRSLTWAVSYNVIALAIAFSGAMNPLSAAILMPLSTLISVSIVMAAIGPKGTLWTHSTSASSSACA